MANSIVQTIREAEIDARSLSEFVSKDAYFTVTRRLAPTIHTLDYYLLVLNKVKEKGDLADMAISDTLDKLEQLEPTVIQRVEDAIYDTVLSSGFVTIDSFELGATITQRNQALRHAADGKLYRWAGDLPKVVPANSTPTSSGGMGDNAWLEVSDVTLRQELANPDNGAVMVGYAGGNVSKALDKRTIFVESVSELEELSLDAGVNVYLTQDGRSGAGVIKSGVHVDDPEKGIFIDLRNGNYWQRDTDYVNFEMFGALGYPNNDATAVGEAIRMMGNGYRLEVKASSKYYISQGVEIICALPAKSSHIMNFNNSEIVCASNLQITSDQPSIPITISSNILKGVNVFSLVDASEVEKGDVIVISSPALRSELGPTQRQTYRVRDVVANDVFIFGSVICDMTESQIIATGQTGEITAELIKPLDKVTVNELKHSHYEYANNPTEVSFRVYNTSLVEMNNCVVKGPNRAGIRHQNCGEVLHTGTNSESIGYASGNGTLGDVMNQYGYAVISSDVWRIRYSRCRFSNGWTGTDSAIGVVITEARNCRYENFSGRGFSTHPGCWLIDIQGCEFERASFGSSNTSGVILKNNNFWSELDGTYQMQLPKQPANGIVIRNNNFKNIGEPLGSVMTSVYVGNPTEGSASSNNTIVVDISFNTFYGKSGLLLSELESDELYFVKNNIHTKPEDVNTGTIVTIRLPSNLLKIDGNSFWHASASRDIELNGPLSDNLEIHITGNQKSFGYANTSFPSLVRFGDSGTATGYRLIVNGNEGNYSSDILRYAPTGTAWDVESMVGNIGFLMPCMRNQDWNVMTYANNVMRSEPNAQTIITNEQNNLVI